MATYARVNDGSGAVYNRTTNQMIPPDLRSRAWVEYLDWVDAGGTPDADVRTISGARGEAEAQIHLEAERELAKWEAALGGGVLSTLDFDGRRREATAADAEGSPWASGYAFLSAQVGIHGADIGAVATYWLGQWATYEAEAARIEATRETAVADVAAAGTITAVDLVVADLTWPNNPRAKVVSIAFTAPTPTLLGPAALITLSPAAAVVQVAPVDVAVAIA